MQFNPEHASHPGFATIKTLIKQSGLVRRDLIPFDPPYQLVWHRWTGKVDADTKAMLEQVEALGYATTGKSVIEWETPRGEFSVSWTHKGDRFLVFDYQQKIYEALSCSK